METPSGGTAVVGYVRVSTARQAESGLGLEDQTRAIRVECERRGWTLRRMHVDAGVSAGRHSRPALDAALAEVRSGVAAGIVVSKLDRLVRSTAQFGYLMERAVTEGWNIVALDMGIDLTTPNGEFMANVMAAVARWERRIIGSRTKEALAVKRADGVRLGRPLLTPLAVSNRIADERAAGGTWRAIADGLNADDVPTALGGKRWYPSTVRAVWVAMMRTAA